MPAPNCYNCDNPRVPGRRACRECDNQTSLASYHRNKEKRLTKLADARKNGPKGRQIFERMQLVFDAVEADTDECILWPHMKHKQSGYGTICWERQRYTVSRLVLELSLGRPLAEGMETLHSCNTRLCYNVRHLREGTHQENMLDVSVAHKARGEKRKYKSKITREEVF